MGSRGRNNLKKNQNKGKTEPLRNQVNVTEPVQEQSRLRIAVATVGLFEASPLPMWIYNLRTLAFLAVNEAAIKCYRYSREEFLATTVRQLHLPAERSAFLDGVLKAPASSRSEEHTSELQSPMY